MIEIGAGGGSIAERRRARGDPRRPAQRRRRSRSGLLRPRRRRADADRCQSRARLSRRGVLPRRQDAARSPTRARRPSIRRGRRDRSASTSMRAAWGIHEVINEDVARAFRVHASERGFDYRRCSMIAFGGSGPIHALRIARKLRIPRVVCPSAPASCRRSGCWRARSASRSCARAHRASPDARRRAIRGHVPGAGRDEADPLSAPRRHGRRRRSPSSARSTCATTGQGYEIEVAAARDATLASRRSRSCRAVRRRLRRRLRA